MKNKLLIPFALLSPFALANMDNRYPPQEPWNIDVTTGFTEQEQPPFLLDNMESVARNNLIISPIYWSAGQDPITRGDVAHALDKGQLVFIDVAGEQNKKDIYMGLLGVGFGSDAVIISKTNGLITYTPVDVQSFIDESRFIGKIQSLSANLEISNTNSENDETPPRKKHVESFYLNPSKSFSCTVRLNATVPGMPWSLRNQKVCEEGQIDLLYLIEKYATVPFNSSSPIKKEKRVRVSLVENSAGAGMGLNNNLWTKEFYYKQSTDIKYYVYSAHANKYKLSTEVTGTANERIKIRGFLPENQNNDYTNTKTNSLNYSYGYQQQAKVPGGSVAMGDSESRTLTWNTQDFRIQTYQQGQTSSFTFQRERYADHCELLYGRTGNNCWYTATIYNGHWPAVNIEKLRSSPIGWSNFIPNLYTEYTTDVDTVGEGKIKVSAELEWVGLMSDSRRSIGHYAYGIIQSHKAPAKAEDEIIFNWNDPIFLGKKTVNIRLEDHDNRCLQVDDKKLTTASCDLTSGEQSFVFTEYRNYRSAKNVKLCLDSKSTDTVSDCNNSQSQKWQWSDDDKGDFLISRAVAEEGTAVYLAYEKASGNLMSLELDAEDPQVPPGYSIKFGTEFSTPWHERDSQ